MCVVANVHNPSFGSVGGIWLKEFDECVFVWCFFFVIKKVENYLQTHVNKARQLNSYKRSNCEDEYEIIAGILNQFSCFKVSFISSSFWFCKVLSNKLLKYVHIYCIVTLAIQTWIRNCYKLLHSLTQTLFFFLCISKCKLALLYCIGCLQNESKCTAKWIKIKSTSGMNKMRLKIPPTSTKNK